MKAIITKIQFVVCIKNDDCGDLELRKIYEVLPDEKAAADNYIRVINESGEDYHYIFLSRQIAARRQRNFQNGGLTYSAKKKTANWF